MEPIPSYDSYEVSSNWRVLLAGNLDFSLFLSNRPAPTYPLSVSQVALCFLPMACECKTTRNFDLLKIQKMLRKLSLYEGVGEVALSPAQD